MATSLTNLYADIDLKFTRNPVTGDVAFSYDNQAVIRSVRNLLLTNFYERLFQPKLGSNITAFLFEPVNAITAGAIEAEIENVITMHEPRASVIAVRVTPKEDENAFIVELTFYIGNNTQPSTVNVLLQRTR
jgi:phage baseplate assembly protein W